MFIPMIVMGESEYYGLAVISGFVLALGGIIYAGDMKCPGCGLKIGFGNSKLFDDVYVRKTFAPKRCVQCGYDLTGNDEPEEGETNNIHNETRMIDVVKKTLLNILLMGILVIFVLYMKGAIP